MPSYFISGANRGIGLAIVKKLLQNSGAIVVAGARDPSRAQTLNDLKAHHTGRLEIVPFDLGDPAKIEQAAEMASSFLPEGLDCLINNAALSFQPMVMFADLDLKSFEEEFHLNVVAQILVVRTFLPLVRKGHAKKVVYVSSDLGSVETAAYMQELGNAYSATKAALNIVARKWGTTLKAEGITTIVLHPGWVATDMGKSIEGWVSEHNLPVQMISSDQSADGVIKVITEAKLEDATAFFKYDGSRIPW
ncbi:hypothetical protein B0H21DRAFT_221164 [Amylocystis lapponica]|nr:hypothetical protein B0H21DRAFT_221164 [Amylocystis lapponica]